MPVVTRVGQPRPHAGPQRLRQRLSADPADPLKQVRVALSVVAHGDQDDNRPGSRDQFQGGTGWAVGEKDIASPSPYSR